MMRADRVAAPTFEPLTVQEVRMHLKNPEITENNAEILWFIKSAREACEHKLGRAIVTQTWEATFDGFPPFVDSAGRCTWPYYTGTGCDLCRDIPLPYPPLQSVTSIKYLDGNNAEQTMSAADYTVITSGTYGCVRLNPTASWPAIGSGYPAVKIRFVAGWATPDTVPENIKHWMKLYVESCDKYRGMQGEREIYSSPFAERLLDRDRIVSV